MTHSSPSLPPALASFSLSQVMINIGLPTLILLTSHRFPVFSSTQWFCVAVFFPIAAGIYSLFTEKQVKPVTCIGFVSVVLTAAIGILKLNPHWLAVKEAIVPLCFGVFVLLSRYSPTPFVVSLLSAIIDLPKIRTVLAKTSQAEALDKTLNTTTLIISLSFLLSAILNYFLTKFIVVSMPGTLAFNAEVGKLNLLSYPVIALPSLICFLGGLWYLFYKSKQLTRLTFQDLLPDYLK